MTKGSQWIENIRSIKIFNSKKPARLFSVIFDIVMSKNFAIAMALVAAIASFFTPIGPVFAGIAFSLSIANIVYNVAIETITYRKTCELREKLTLLLKIEEMEAKLKPTEKAVTKHNVNGGNLLRAANSFIISNTGHYPVNVFNLVISCIFMSPIGIASNTLGLIFTSYTSSAERYSILQQQNSLEAEIKSRAEKLGLDPSNIHDIRERFDCSIVKSVSPNTKDTQTTSQSVPLFKGAQRSFFEDMIYVLRHSFFFSNYSKIMSASINDERIASVCTKHYNDAVGAISKQQASEASIPTQPVKVNSKSLEQSKSLT